MASRAWQNAIKIGNTEVLSKKVEFEISEDTKTFDLGDIALDATGIRIEAILNGSVLNDSDWTINADDNTAVDMAESIPADNNLVFKVFIK